MWKNLSEVSGKKPQRTVDFKPSPKIRRSRDVDVIALIFEAGFLLTMDVPVSKE